MKRDDAVEAGVHIVLDAPGVLYDPERKVWYGITEAALREAMSGVYAAALDGERERCLDAVRTSSRRGASMKIRSGSVGDA